MNFLANVAQVASTFHDTFELINMQRWLDHVAKCPDPMCGLFIAVDGACKVVRDICGAPLPVEEDCQLDPSLTDVQNVMHRDSLRKKVCDNMPGSRRGARDGYIRGGHCATCKTRLQGEEDNIEPHSDSQPVHAVPEHVTQDNISIQDDVV